MLTKEQRDLVSKNYGLLYGCANKYNLDLEEQYGLLAIGLCRAAETYNASHGCTFASWAYTWMLGQVSHDYSPTKRGRRIPKDVIISYDTPVSGSEHGETHMLDILDDDGCQTNFDATEAEVEDFIRSLPAKHQVVCRRLMEGHIMDTIGAEIGCTRSNVELIKRAIRQRWQEYAADKAA